ncbi:MAG: tetratricopeptide repeat protein [Desulfobulbaceae bacterium]|nr:tetratricopeptide repeat protein [Desulfobulbaceae bacterium]
MLPVAGTVDLWAPARSKEQKKKWAGDQGLEDQLTAHTLSLQPGIVLNRIILPLEIENGENIAAVVRDIDPGLLGKMAREWLSEFRASVQKLLENVRKEFTDPVTGLYNSRSLMDRLEQSAATGRDEVLFLICAGSRIRTGTNHLSKTVQAGSFLDAMTRAPLFYLGGNVFGLLQDNLTRQEALKTAHRLLHLLKREGLRSTHIGISVPDEAGKGKGAIPVLEECWRALETAESRGTFSLCEGSYLENSVSHPLELPEKQVLSQLRKKWRGLKQFGLILVSIQNLPAETAEESTLAGIAAGMLPAGVSFMPLSANQGYILVPGGQPAKALNLGTDIKKKIEKKYASVSVDLGISHWPLLQYTKTESAVNCRKALMHGRFFGPGAVTVFDHVSLNVSGDYFFDEGNYRQAVRDYRTGVRLASEDVNLLNSLGVSMTALNRLREAVIYFEQVLGIDPGNFMALVNMGFTQRTLGNKDKAVHYFEQASRHSEFAQSAVFEELSLQLARLYCDQEHYGNALQLLENLEGKKNGSPGYPLFFLFGEAYAGSGRYKKAISFLQKAVRMNPHDARALSLLGELYALEDQGDEIALSLCRKAVDIDDCAWQHWYRLGLVLFRMGRLAGARSAVRKSLRFNRNSIKALSLAEQIYLHSGEHGKAGNMHKRIEKIARVEHQGAGAALN